MTDRKALKGKYRVVGVDTFDGTDWVQGDFDTKEDALMNASLIGAEMTKVHVYDDAGRHIGEAGSF